jgi:REP element-mobilizing transposase RayT
MSNYPKISIPLTPGCGYHIFNQGNEKRNIFFKHRNYKYFMDKYREYMSGFVDTYAYCLLPNHFHLMVKIKQVSEILQEAERVGFQKVNSLFMRRYVLPWFFQPNASGLGLTVLPLWKGTAVEKILPGLKATSISEMVELLNLRSESGENQTPFFSHPEHLEKLNSIHQLCSYIVSERFRRFLLSFSKAINVQEDRTGSLFRKAFRRKWIPSQEDAKKVITYIHHNSIHHGFNNDYHLHGYNSFNGIINDESIHINPGKVFDLFGGLNAFIDFGNNYKKHKWEKENFSLEGVATL